MSDITENLIHTSDAVSSPSTSDELQGSSRTPTPTPTKRAPKNDPPGRLDGKTKESQTGLYSTHKKMVKRQHKNVKCVCEKISRKKLGFSVLSVVFLCIQKAATHDITR